MYQSYTNERAATDFIGYVATPEKEDLVKTLAKRLHFFILSNESADKSIHEQELLCVLLLYEGISQVTFIDIKTPGFSFELKEFSTTLQWIKSIKMDRI